MKKLGCQILVLCLLIFVSCSKNSDNDNTNDNDSEPQPVDKSLNLKGTGDSANEILANEIYTDLLIEIAHVEGFKPTAEAITNFVDFLRERTFKENIQVVYKEVESPNEESLTLPEIAELESEHRTAYNNGETLAIYIYFADSPAEDDDEDEGLVTLGAVYRNTSMIIHEATVKKLATLSPSISVTDVETATLNHEFGHLFGLVDLGTPEINPHEDLTAINHCNIEGCLMRAELQFGGPSNKSALFTAKNGNVEELKFGCALSGNSVLQMLVKNTAKGSANIVPLDAECIRDLQANGGK